MDPIGREHTILIVSDDLHVIKGLSRTLSPLAKCNVLRIGEENQNEHFTKPFIAIIDARKNSSFEIAQNESKNLSADKKIFLVCEKQFASVQNFSLAKNCIPFPCDSAVLKKFIEKRFYEEVAQENFLDKESALKLRGFETLLGSSNLIMKIKEKLFLASQVNVPVLLLGESGTGKTFAAKLIHENSSRAKNRFVTIDLPSVVEGLAESDLFGTVAGAYTGAVKRRGKIASADGGTLFLDEIGEASVHLQTKFLRVLETGNYARVGSDIEHHVDVRIISATNENLFDAISMKKFRQDLYFRITDYIITMPPLRAYKSDVPHMVSFFLAGSGKELSALALEKIMDYDWPGNIRQLKSCIRRAIFLSSRKIISDDAIEL